MAKYPYYIEGSTNGIRDRYFVKILSSASYIEVYNQDGYGIQSQVVSKGKSTDELFRRKRSDGVWEVKLGEYFLITEERFNEIFMNIVNKMLLVINHTKEETYNKSQVESLLNKIETTITQSSESFKQAQVKALNLYKDKFFN